MICVNSTENLWNFNAPICQQQCSCSSSVEWEVWDCGTEDSALKNIAAPRRQACSCSQTQRFLCPSVLCLVYVLSQCRNGRVKLITDSIKIFLKWNILTKATAFTVQNKGWLIWTRKKNNRNGLGQSKPSKQLHWGNSVTFNLYSALNNRQCYHQHMVLILLLKSVI